MLSQSPAPAMPPDPLALVAAPEVRAAIVGVLVRKGVPFAEREDFVQATFVRAIAAKDRPTSVRGWASLGAKIATDLLTDAIRKKSARRKHDVGLCDDADERGAEDGAAPRDRDPVDAQRQLDLLKEMMAAGDVSPEAVAALEAVSRGVPQTEIAADLGIRHQSVRNLLSRTRARYVARWAAVACGAAVVGVVVWLLGSDRDQVAHPPPAPTQETPVPSPMAPDARARELRSEALHQCDLRHWTECVRGLDDARAIDPAGDDAPAVKRARERAARGRAN